MKTPTTPEPSSDAERTPRVRDRVLHRVEARNELTATDAPGAFDFAVADEAGGSSLGLLASYLGAAACRQSFSLGLAVDVSRVVVEVERPAARSDGGTAPLDDHAGDDGRPGVTAGPETRPNRVRALVEARTDEPTAALATWRERLVADPVPFSMVPGLVGVDLVCASTTGREPAGD
jgi:hypothetical protein